MSLIALGTLSGSLQPLTRYGPEGVNAWLWTSQPSGLDKNATNFLASASLAPVVVFGM